VALQRPPTRRTHRWRRWRPWRPRTTSPSSSPTTTSHRPPPMTSATAPYADAAAATRWAVRLTAWRTWRCPSHRCCTCQPGGRPVTCWACCGHNLRRRGSRAPQSCPPTAPTTPSVRYAPRPFPCSHPRTYPRHTPLKLARSQAAVCSRKIPSYPHRGRCWFTSLLQPAVAALKQTSATPSSPGATIGLSRRQILSALTTAVGAAAMVRSLFVSSLASSSLKTARCVLTHLAKWLRGNWHSNQPLMYTTRWAGV
jgi:hypothetical protein